MQQNSVALALFVSALFGPMPVIRAQSRAAPAPVNSQATTAPVAPVQTATPQQGAIGHATEKPLAFDAASIKPYNNSGGGGRNGGTGGAPPAAIGGGALRFTPGRVASSPRGVTARKMILEAYHLTQYQLSGGPGWLDSEWFSVEAKAEAANENQLRQMLQTLLAERFKLVVHRESKEKPVYALVVGKNGTKLREWKEGDPMPEFGGANNFRDRGTMQHFADFLSNAPGVARPVLDKTSLQGVYVFYVEWAADEDFLPAMQAQLGLKLEPQKAPIDIFVIDHVEKPSEN